jgi:hypothetical protein
LASDDDETKKSGLVLIIAPTSEQQSVSDPEEHVEVAKFAQAMPLRFAAIHICVPDDGPMFQLLRATIVLLFARIQRIRVKFHTGTANPSPDYLKILFLRADEMFDYPIRNH